MSLMGHERPIQQEPNVQFLPECCQERTFGPPSPFRRFVPLADSCTGAKKSGRAAPVISFVYLSAKCLFNKFYGINCRPKFDTKLFDRFFHRRRQVSPPVNSLTHRFLDGSKHVFYCNVTIG